MRYQNAQHRHQTSVQERQQQLVHDGQRNQRQSGNNTHYKASRTSPHISERTPVRTERAQSRKSQLSPPRKSHLSPPRKSQLSPPRKSQLSPPRKSQLSPPRNVRTPPRSLPLHDESNSSSTAQRVWVRTDVVEAIQRHGGLPKGWKPRKRLRDERDAWGWCRARVTANDRNVSHANCHNSGSNQASGASPFGSIQLRKTSKPTRWKETTQKQQHQPQTVAVTVTIDDPELAPPELDQASVQLVYSTGDHSIVCPTNSWWQNSGEFPPDDLTALEQLHEPSVVYCLQERYERDIIYTYTGKILLALNPFRAIDCLYSADVMAQYWQNDYSGERPAPHIYAVAEDAYRSMISSIQMKESVMNQSILVSGESGAGKTVTTKIIMKYLATLSSSSNPGNKRKSHGDVGIETQVLLSNPVLESFGNARTVRNDNSSRFGKFIEILFEKTGCLTSAKIETYLLEKVRLISQAPGERNYHVFYELLAGFSHKERRAFHLGNATASDFRMTCQSGTFDRRDGVDDRMMFGELQHALMTVGFRSSDQTDLFRVACGLLHASNLTFVEMAADSSALDRQNPSFAAAVNLFGVHPDALDHALCKHSIHARNEVLYKNLNVRSANKALEALIKTTYGALFQHIVRRVNAFISGEVHRGASIGVLDIFGFESFEVNSFEQLCINYCNEALQQQFNRFVFKLEQQEYQKEGIQWSFISFPDNQDILDLIETKHNGILSILDEQSRLPRCTDATFASAVYEKCEDHGRFEATKAHRAACVFAIHHYAGPVEYNTAHFLEKNKDEVPPLTTELLQTSEYPLLASLGDDLAGQAAVASLNMNTNNQGSSRKYGNKTQRSGSSLIRDSVGTQFRSQLLALRGRIESTSPHYVRCLKPNDDLVPHSFNSLVIADQLNCAGVLEAIRVSRIGFPHRYSHDRFVLRYSLLARRRVQGRSMIEDCERLVEALVPAVQSMDHNEGQKEQQVFYGMQMGRTKVFLRRRAFEALEHLRGRKLDDSAAKIQAMARMQIARINFEVARYAATVIQRFYRHVEAHRIAQEARIDGAVTTIQRAWRCYSARKIYYAALTIAWWCQSAYRGFVARQYCAYVFLDQKVCSIQRAWKRYVSARTFRKVRRAVICIQGRHRCRIARRELLRLRREARDLSSVAAERDKLKQESRKLKEELEKAKREAASTPKVVYKKVDPVPPRSEEVDRLKMELETLRKELSAATGQATSPRSEAVEVTQLKEELARREEQLEFLRQEVLSLRSHGDSFSIQSFVIEHNNSMTREQMSPLPIASSTKSQNLSSDVSLLDGLSENVPPSVNTSSSSDRRLPPLAPSTVVSTPSSTHMSAFSSPGIPANELRYLQHAIRQRNYKLLLKLLQQSRDAVELVNQVDEQGRTPMHMAALSHSADITRALIENGAAVNAQDFDGETPLHLSEMPEVTATLLETGNANPNIPNIDGICALHLAVQRRDARSVEVMLRFNADVNNADNVRWFTSLHLVALPPRADATQKMEPDLGTRISQLLTRSRARYPADLDYQDREGNTPLHYAVQLDTEDACGIVSVFLERGADPNIRNERNQCPLHLLCHNEELRRMDIFHEILHSMLFHNADPNQQSLTGCTPLHLTLYHRDIDSTVQLVRGGAELHFLWKKPKRWHCFWKDMGEKEILALDMLEDEDALRKILSAINRPHKRAPSRSWCMNCRQVLGTYSRALHCRHCSRFVCGRCTASCLPAEYFPKSFRVTEPSWTCVVCEKILLSRKEDMSNGTCPASSYGDDDDDKFSC